MRKTRRLHRGLWQEKQTGTTNTSGDGRHPTSAGRGRKKLKFNKIQQPQRITSTSLKSPAPPTPTGCLAFIIHTLPARRCSRESRTTCGCLEKATFCRNAACATCAALLPVPRGGHNNGAFWRSQNNRERRHEQRREREREGKVGEKHKVCVCGGGRRPHFLSPQEVKRRADAPPGGGEAGGGDAGAELPHESTIAS